MHLLVIAAFALVLATPTRGFPWTFDFSDRLTLAVVVGQLAAFLLLVLAGTVLTLRRMHTGGPFGSDGQRFFGRFQFVWRLVLFVITLCTVQFTPWVRLVRTLQIGPDGWSLASLWGVPDLAVLLPFFVGAVAAWTVQYPVDRAMREMAAGASLLDGRPARPVWSFRQYLSFHIRNHLLLIVVPMAVVLALRDAQPYYGRILLQWTGDPAAGHLAFLAGVGVVFLFSPILMCWIWSTVALPPGELRTRLENLCQRIGLRYRQILIWKSDGVLVNAAVMGLVGPLRYILLSDGLLESMEDEKIEAVFGHEAGHVAHHHIPYYLAFAVLSMLVSGGVMLLLWDRLPTQWFYFVEVMPLILLALIWLVGFGWVSRRFERQADLYGARCVTPDSTGCVHACVVHECSDVDPGDDAAKATGANSSATTPPYALCRTAAETFAQALERIAALNGIAPNARSWRHSSIASRAAFLRKLAREPKAVLRFDRVVASIKVVLIVGMAVGLPLTVYLYWTDRLPPQMLGF